MALTKSFRDLVQRRAAADPDFAAALRREGIDPMLTGGTNTGNTAMTKQEDTRPKAPLTFGEALCKVWEADKYPILGNEDWRAAARQDAETLEMAATAAPSPDDPPNSPCGWQPC